MKSFAEQAGKKPFDWNAFLSKESYSDLELEEAKGLSLTWITCACGNQCDAIPRNNMGQPEDGDLIDLGLRFSMEIERMDREFFTGGHGNPGLWKSRDVAKEILILVEKRSAYLLQKLNLQSNE